MRESVYCHFNIFGTGICEQQQLTFKNWISRNSKTLNWAGGWWFKGVIGKVSALSGSSNLGLLWTTHNFSLFISKLILLWFENPKLCQKWPKSHFACNCLQSASSSIQSFGISWNLIFKSQLLQFTHASAKSLEMAMNGFPDHLPLLFLPIAQKETTLLFSVRWFVIKSWDSVEKVTSSWGHAHNLRLLIWKI